MSVIESQEIHSLEATLSTLLTAKLFVDAGVNPDEFRTKDIYVNFYRGDTNGYEIFIEGLNFLFEEIEEYDPYDNSREELLEVGISANGHEKYLILKDKLFNGCKTIDLSEYKRIIDQDNLFFDMGFEWASKCDGILISLDGIGYYHSLTRAILKLRDDLKNRKEEIVA
ncbi:hypothetical protein [Terribacillus sp. DMT04]|uniref:hypothetical protein n=1 Tax=Terribacillus sp. DMT04 TaxID=2850441 RepID=UPI001C2BF573|nr:hypothetical protein [Terribacillus sp. DMT04]QXE03518.1 hypothetical protein KS242_17710 [Terribacillus sp. DMT04]